ncbi:DNA repair protein RAD14 [Nosema granulosis]|uniref:DNA repair protein RAD14 n=1 Tax=Nosema granulosis TaxID=83296 RepID=A0A9P6L0Y1_9MICR|nr:DNA repair protein RAD14 [Nosema granulosis]
MSENENGFFPENKNDVSLEETVKIEDVPLILPLSDLNTCKYCSSLPLDPEILKIFGLNICKQCRYTKLKFVTKTTANREYLLSNEDFKDLHYISRPNPHKGTWHDMQLYLLDEILEIAFKKYETLEKIEEVKQERDEKNKKRKIKKLKTKIRELKRRTIVKQSQQVKHTHVFSGEGCVKQCDICGMEVEQEEL